MVDQPQPKCTCNDEFQTQVCPVHFGQQQGQFGVSELIIDDTRLTKNAPSAIWGHLFVCPGCQLASILHMFNYCPNCGTKVKVQSVATTEYIKAVMAQQKSGK